MKTFDEFLTESRRANFSTFKSLARQAKKQVGRVAKSASSSKPAKRAKRYIKATAAGIALKLLTGL